MKKIMSILLSIFMLLNIFCALGITVSAETNNSSVYVFIPKSLINGQAWKTPIYCYVYDEIDTKTYPKYFNESWPGVEMSYDSQNQTYYCEIPSDTCYMIESASAAGAGAYVKANYDLAHSSRARVKVSDSNMASNGSRAPHQCPGKSGDTTPGFLLNGISHTYKQLYGTESTAWSVTTPNQGTKDTGTFNNGEWELDFINGVLKITGNGNMEFGYNQTIPWSIYRNEIKSVVIESGITNIADYAFISCTNLKSVTIPNTVSNIGESAFEGCTDLTYLNIPRNSSYIAQDAFYGCKKLQTINLSSNIFIGDGAFTDCTSLNNVNLSFSVSVIGDNAFSNCTSLASITIPKCDSPLGRYAFSGCTNLANVTIANGLPSIESSAFYGCTSLKSISIPDSVESIGEEAFGNCKNLDSVTIGTGCKSIASKAFWDCPKLTKITINYPNCVFNNSQYTISTTAVICGYKNSTAYSYARTYMRSFVDIETGIRYGWIDGSFIEIIEDDPTDPTTPSAIPTNPTTPAEKISRSNASIKAGGTVALNVSNGTVKTWSTSNKAVATVSKGKVTGLKKGSATITATTTTGKKLTCKVTVTTSPKLSKSSVTVKKGKTISVKITGKASTVKNVYTNTKYAKVVSNNTATTIKIKGLKKGSTTLNIKVNGVVLKLKVKVT